MWFQDQIDELQTQVEKQKKEIKKRKDQQNTLQTEIDDLREEMGRIMLTPVFNNGSGPTLML